MPARSADEARRLVETDILLGVGEIPLVHLDQPGDPEPSPEIPGEPAAAPVVAATVLPRVAPRAPSGDREAALEHLRERHDLECPHCTRVKTHTRTVFGEGSAHAQIFFVGEAPGETEDQVGRPFVGRAGQKLDEMIKAMGLTREVCYIANVLKSRPPNNRTPLPAEIAMCSPYLVEQILIVQPKVLVPLGGPATQLLLRVDTGITKLRGQWTVWTPPEGSPIGPIPVMPTFHPAYLLRNYTVQTRSEVWSDLKAVMDRLARVAASA